MSRYRFDFLGRQYLSRRTVISCILVLLLTLSRIWLISRLHWTSHVKEGLRRGSICMWLETRHSQAAGRESFASSRTSLRIPCSSWWAAQGEGRWLVKAVVYGNYEGRRSFDRRRGRSRRG